MNTYIFATLLSCIQITISLFKYINEWIYVLDNQDSWNVQSRLTSYFLIIYMYKLTMHLTEKKLKRLILLIFILCFLRFIDYASFKFKSNISLELDEIDKVFNLLYVIDVLTFKSMSFFILKGKRDFWK